MNETHIRVKGEWRYLYRAVDKHGQTIDFLLTEHRFFSFGFPIVIANWLSPQREVPYSERIPGRLWLSPDADTRSLESMPGRAAPRACLRHEGNPMTPQTRKSTAPLAPIRLSLDALTQRNIALIAALENVEVAKRSWAERVSDLVTRFGGSITFLYLHIGWFSGWLLWNLSPRVPPALRFDPMPFPLLNHLVALEAVVLSTFILMSQRRQDQLADRRNHLDLQINLLSEQENSKMLTMLAALMQHQGLALEDPERLFEKFKLP